MTTYASAGVDISRKIHPEMDPLRPSFSFSVSCPFWRGLCRLYRPAHVSILHGRVSGCPKAHHRAASDDGLNFGVKTVVAFDCNEKVIH